MLSSVISDFRQGARAVLTGPTFAVVVMLTLSLGAGANVAIFSLADQILLRPLAVPEPERSGEIGLRIALGAPTRRVRGMVLAALRSE